MVAFRLFLLFVFVFLVYAFLFLSLLVSLPGDDVIAGYSLVRFLLSAFPNAFRF